MAEIIKFPRRDDPEGHETEIPEPNLLEAALSSLSAEDQPGIIAHHRDKLERVLRASVEEADKAGEERLKRCSEALDDLRLAYEALNQLYRQGDIYDVALIGYALEEPSVVEEALVALHAEALGHNKSYEQYVSALVELHDVPKLRQVVDLFIQERTKLIEYFRRKDESQVDESDQPADYSSRPAYTVVMDVLVEAVKGIDDPKVAHEVAMKVLNQYATVETLSRDYHAPVAAIKLYEHFGKKELANQFFAKLVEMKGSKEPNPGTFDPVDAVCNISIHTSIEHGDRALSNSIVDYSRQQKNWHTVMYYSLLLQDSNIAQEGLKHFVLSGDDHSNSVVVAEAAMLTGKEEYKAIVGRVAEAELKKWKESRYRMGQDYVLRGVLKMATYSEREDVVRACERYLEDVRIKVLNEPNETIESEQVDPDDIDRVDVAIRNNDFETMRNVLFRYSEAQAIELSDDNSLPETADDAETHFAKGARAFMSRIQNDRVREMCEALIKQAKERLGLDTGSAK